MRKQGCVEHLHSPDILVVNCLEVKDRMKRKARQTHETTRHILGDELEIITGTTAAKIPKLYSMKRTIRSTVCKWLFLSFRAKCPGIY